VLSGVWLPAGYDHPCRYGYGQSFVRACGSPYAFGLTEPIGLGLRLFQKIGHIKIETDRLVSKLKTEQVRSRSVRFGLGHDRTNRTSQNIY
jgi:hypothetical protein